MSNSNFNSDSNTDAGGRQRDKTVIPPFILAMIVSCTVVYFMGVLGIVNPQAFLLSTIPFSQWHLIDGLWLLFAHTLMHSNLGHLIGNMMFLMAIGVGVEPVLGTKRTAVVYWGGAVFAGVWFLFATIGEPLIPGANGASAAVAAVMGAALLVSRNSVVFEYPAFTLMVKETAVNVPRICVKSWFIVVMFVLQNLQGVFFLSDVPGVMAQTTTHLAGFAAGFAIAYWFKTRAVDSQ